MSDVPTEPLADLGREIERKEAELAGAMSVIDDIEGELRDLNRRRDSIRCHRPLTMIEDATERMYESAMGKLLYNTEIPLYSMPFPDKDDSNPCSRCGKPNNYGFHYCITAAR